MKTSTKVLLLIVFMQCAATVAMMLLHMVVMWEEIGRGLNPWIGIPGAIFISLAPYVVYSLWFESDRPTKFDLKTIEMPLKPKSSDTPTRAKPGVDYDY